MPPGGVRRSGDDAEPAHPGDLLGRGERDLQEADGLELTGARQRPASITFTPPAATTSARVFFASASSPAMSTVVARSPRVPAARAGEVGVEALDDLRARQRLGELGGGGGVRARRESNVSKFTGLVMSTTIFRRAAPRAAIWSRAA